MHERDTQDPRPASAAPERGTLGEVAALFLKLGCIAFGGPAAHIALMRDEVVRRRHWLDEQQFLDLIGAANVIPGPSSTEVAIFLGYRRAGWRGLVLAGVLFILPAMLIVLAFAWAYQRYGATPQAGWVLYGIKPVIIAVVVQAIWGLGRTAVKDAFLAVVGLVVLAGYLLGANVIVLLFGAGLVVLLVRNRARLLWLLRPGAAVLLPGLGLGAGRAVLLPSAGPRAGHAVPLPGAGLGAAAAKLLPRLGLGAVVAQAAAPAVPVSLPLLFLTFLKFGAVVLGSGYVLLAFLRTDLVENLGWLTDQQLIDAVAVGQFTPGPVFTTATFIGYLLGGLPGALLCTVAIFLPGFIFVALIYPLVPRLRGSPWTSAFLDGVNVAAIGLMAGVTWDLARAALLNPTTGLPDPFAVTLAVVAAVLLVRFQVNSAWLVLGGGVLGAVVHLVGG
ncbi:MAG TPA: chromate efflux transporter [Chloroflexota bacterium]|jgi:chromate transporter